MALIRPATKEDSPKILELIHELALYEKDPEAVKTSEEDIIRDGFSDHPFFKCIVAEADNEIAGFALYFFTWSTWEGRPSLYLEDLFVRKEARGKKLGFKLFKKLSEFALENNCKRLDFSVLDWNTPSIDFYKKIGAKEMTEWLSFRLEGEALNKLAHEH